MNRSRMKQLYILLGILVVISIATFGISKIEQHKEKIKNSDEVILEVSADDVQSLSWDSESGSLAFHKDDTWLYDEDETFPVDEEKIQERLDLFAEFGVSFVIEDVEDYGQYGLDDPVCTISLATADDTYEIKLGDYSTMDSERYVSIGDGNVYLVTTDPLEEFDVELSDMILQDEIPQFDTVKSMTFAGTEDYELTYEEDSTNTYCANDVYFTEKDGEVLPLKTSSVSSYLWKLSYLSPTDYVTYNASEEDLSDYGLDDPELTVTIQYEPEEDEEDETGTFTLAVGRVSEDEDADAYIRIGDSELIYKVDSDTHDKLTDVSYDTFRHDEVFSGDFSDINQIDITLDDETYTIEVSGKSDDRTYKYQDEEIEISSFESALNSLNADSFTDEQPEEKEEISLVLHLDNENYPEVKIQLYRYDGSSCLAVIAGTPVSLVERADVIDLVEAVNAIVLN